MFDDHARSVFASIADVLIPAAEGMPAASEAGVASLMLDAVLAARPDLAEPLERLVARADGRDPAGFVATLQADDVASFGLLAEIVPNAYFMNPAVRQLLGYPGQLGLEPDLSWPPDWLNLLEPVIARGPIYRVAPASEPNS